MKSPCRECEKRHLACHDHCPDYQEWKQWRNEGWKRKCEEAAVHATMVNSVMETKRKSKVK